MQSQGHRWKTRALSIAIEIETFLSSFFSANLELRVCGSNHSRTACGGAKLRQLANLDILEIDWSPFGLQTKVPFGGIGIAATGYFMTVDP